eukprot:1326719-Prymnesium_polylepis.1
MAAASRRWRATTRHLATRSLCCSRAMIACVGAAGCGLGGRLPGAAFPAGRPPAQGGGVALACADA